jgi:hypothetical protein
MIEVDVAYADVGSFAHPQAALQRDREGQTQAWIA